MLLVCCGPSNSLPIIMTTMADGVLLIASWQTSRTSLADFYGDGGGWGPCPYLNYCGISFCTHNENVLHQPFQRTFYIKNASSQKSCTLHLFLLFFLNYAPSSSADPWSTPAVHRPHNESEPGCITNLVEADFCIFRIKQWWSWKEIYFLKYWINS